MSSPDDDPRPAAESASAPAMFVFRLGWSLLGMSMKSRFAKGVPAGPSYGQTRTENVAGGTNYGSRGSPLSYSKRIDPRNRTDGVVVPFLPGISGTMVPRTPTT